MPQVHINRDSLLGSTTNTNHTGTRTETEGDRENKKKGTTEETEDYNIPWRLPCCHPLMRRTTGAHTNKLKQDKESEIHVESLDPTLSPPDPYQDPTSGCGGSIIMFCQLVLPFFCAYIFVLVTTGVTPSYLVAMASADGEPIFLPMLVASLIVILGVGVLVRRHVEQQEHLFWRTVQERNQALFHSHSFIPWTTRQHMLPLTKRW